MQSRDFVLFAHGAFKGEIEGRTALQKKVFFLSIVLEEDLGYKPHYYGPYSSFVTEANLELKELGYISESLNVYGYDSHGFEMKKYSYALTEDGEKLLGRKMKQFPEEWTKVTNAADTMRAAGRLDYMELAIAAKAYIILRQTGGTSNRNNIKSQAEKLGWSIDNENLEKALTYLEKIDLVAWV